MVRANYKNGVQENVEEPFNIPDNGKVVVTSWKMWMDLCSDNSLKCKVKTLRLRVSDGKKDQPLEIEEFIKMKELVIEDGSFGNTRKVTIQDNKLLEFVNVGSHCFNLAKRSSKNSVVSIKNCPSLASFHVAEGSFKNLLKCEFIGTYKLQVIRWGKGSFENCKAFYPRITLECGELRSENVIGTVRICQLINEDEMEIKCRQ